MGGGVTRTTAAMRESCEIYTTVNFVDTQSGVCVQCVITFCTDIISASSLVSLLFFQLDKPSFVACCRPELIKEALSGEWLVRGSWVHRVTSFLLLRDAQLGNLQWM